MSCIWLALPVLQLLRRKYPGVDSAVATVVRAPLRMHFRDSIWCSDQLGEGGFNVRRKLEGP